jgi:subtilisin-like proprotein convertase family protein
MARATRAVSSASFFSAYKLSFTLLAAVLPALASSARADTSVNGFDFTTIADSPTTPIPGNPAGRFTSVRLAGVENGVAALSVGLGSGRSGIALRNPATGTTSLVIDSTTPTPGGESILSTISVSEFTNNSITFAANTSAGQKLYRWSGKSGSLTTLASAGDMPGGASSPIATFSGGRGVAGDSTGYAFSAALADGSNAFFQSTSAGTGSAVQLADNNMRSPVPETGFFVDFPEASYLNGKAAFIARGLETDVPGGVVEPVGVLVSSPGNPTGVPAFKNQLIPGGFSDEHRFLEFERPRLFSMPYDSQVLGFAGGWIDEENPTSGERFMGVFTIDSMIGWKNWINSEMDLPGLRSPVVEFNGYAIDSGHFAAGAVDEANERYLFAEIDGKFVYVLSTYDTFEGKDLTAIRWNNDMIEQGRLFFTAEFGDGSTGVYAVSVPEPTSLALLSAGAAGLLARRRRRSVGRAVSETLERRQLLCADHLAAIKSGDCGCGANDPDGGKEALQAPADVTVTSEPLGGVGTVPAGGLGLLSSGPEAGPITVLPPVNASASSMAENEVDIAVNPTNPQQVFVVANGTTNLSGAVSTNGGATWTRRNVATGSDGLVAACCDARVEFDAFGNLWMVYIPATTNGLVLARSTNGGASFTQIGSWTGNYDNPSIAVGANNQVWIQTTAPSGQAAFGLQATALGAQGAVSGPLYMPAGSNTGGFGDIIIANDGSVVMTAHASTSGQGPTTLPIWRDPDGLGPSGFTLVTSIATNVGGFDFIPAQNSRSIDAEPGFAVIPAGKPNAGRILMTYTDETVNENNDTNVLLRWSDNNGVTWSSPITLNDDATTRSQFLQSIAVDRATGAIGVFWYDARNDVGTATGGFSDTTANNEAQIYATFSIDGGVTWLPNEQLSAGVSKAAGSGSSIDFGDWTGADFYNGTFFAGWADNSTVLAPAVVSRPALDIAVGRATVVTTPITGITGTIYDDANANGSRDSGEGVRAGVVVYLDLDNSGTLNGTEPNTLANGAGSYSFTGLTAGTYRVRVVQPASSRLTAPAAGFYTATIATNQNLTGQDFGITTAAIVSGVVYEDANNNGVRDGSEPGISGARVYVDGNNNGQYDAGTTNYVSTNVPRALADLATSTSTLVVPAGAGLVTKITAQINVSHTFDGDLVITLIAPDGTRVALATNVGGSGDNFTNTVFDDAASTAIASGTAPFTGTFRPSGSLANFIGKNGSGTWTLEFVDTASGDTGTLNSWSISITSNEQSVVTPAGGAYSFLLAPSATYNIRQVSLGANYVLTQPGGAAYNLTPAGGSLLSTADFGNRNTARPLVASGSFAVDLPTQTLSISFTAPATPTAANFSLVNLTTGVTVPTASIAVAYNSVTNVASLTFPGYANGILPDGNYRLTVLSTLTGPGGAVGNPGPALDFYALAGDANRDRNVNFDDLLVLAANYNVAGKVFSQGNFNYDAGGNVNFDDLLILAANYNKTLAPPAGEAPLLRTPGGSPETGTPGTPAGSPGTPAAPPAPGIGSDNDDNGASSGPLAGVLE